MLMDLPVLPPPWSSSLFPELDRVQRKELRKALVARTGHCAYCGRPFVHTSNRNNSRPTLDHVVPLSKGGKHTIDNLAVICFSCNSLKGNRSPHELLTAWEHACDVLRSMIGSPG